MTADVVDITPRWHAGVARCGTCGHSWPVVVEAGALEERQPCKRCGRRDATPEAVSVFPTTFTKAHVAAGRIGEEV